MLAQLIPLLMLMAAPLLDAQDDALLADAPVVAPPSDDAPLDDAETQSARIDPSDVPDNSSDLSPDVDRWVLHDVLSHGFGETEQWQARLLRQRELGHGAPAPDWQERFAVQRTCSLLRGEPEQHHTVDTQRLHFDIPLMTHPLVDVYIDYFTGRGRWVFERWLTRATQVVPLMQPILARYGVPQDLVYLAMIESGFSPHAYSTAAASGYWQFMAPTGRLYGLQEDLFVDERRDFIRATEAAATYLSSLKRQMGDWHLAWASYNAGEGRIRRALKETQTTTFWELISVKNNLAKETVHYVPKVIAAAIVAKDAERYGFRITPLEPLRFDEVAVKDSLDLTILAKEMRMSPEALRLLNPALLHDMTPPGKSVRIRVPKGAGPQATLALAKLPPSRRLNFLAHAVRRGDTLSGIARKHGSSIAMLQQFNHLGPKTHLKVGQRLIVPSFKGPLATALAARPSPMPKRHGGVPPKLAQARSPSSRPLAAGASRQASVGSKKPRARHVVAYGDTLWSIARRYGVRLSSIKGQSTHRHHRLAVGEVLEIF